MSASRTKGAHSRKTVLLTGFGPFPGVSENATDILVPRLARRARQRFPGVVFRTAILPTEWDRGPARLARLIDRHEPVLRLHFGVSLKAKGFVIETIARNVCGPVRDATGALPPAARILAGGRAHLAVKLPARAIVAGLTRAGFSASLSRDAGHYLCNAVLYHSLLDASRSAPDAQTGFIHVPATIGTGDSAMTWDEAVAGALEIIRLCLETSAGNPSRTG